MNLGRLQGIILFSVGLIFAVFAIVMLNNTGSVMQLFFAAPALLLLGIAMIIFPGSDIPVSEHKDKSKQIEVFTKAPVIHKIIWAVAFILGITISIYYIITSFEI